MANAIESNRALSNTARRLSKTKNFASFWKASLRLLYNILIQGVPWRCHIGENTLNIGDRLFYLKNTSFLFLILPLILTRRRH